ncbi:hypothetical protein PspLS_10106 [Pyricularia sp. CBS 133598]|nr:hypothetical protein PspLS_10106 [Pyricularia sp. CBS 133598]
MPRTERIIVSIDFGTRYTSVLLAINHHGKKSSRPVCEWPRIFARHADEVNVRTTILYDSTGSRTNWKCTGCVKDDSLRWVKVLLDSDSRYFEKIREVQEIGMRLQALGRRSLEEEFYRQSCLWVDMASTNICINDWRRAADRADYSGFGLRERTYIGPLTTDILGLC